MIQSLRQLDETLLLWFNGFHTSFLDNLALSVSSRWLWLPLYVTLFALIARKVGWSRTLVYVTLLFLLTVGLTDYTCASILRPIFQRPRPTQPDSPIFHLVHAVQNYRGGHYGFPSCHASNAFAMATLSTLYFRAWRLSVAMFVWALLLCLSRMYLGVHYPGDILLGATIGVAIAFTTYAAARPLLRPRPNYTKVAFWPSAVIGLLLFSFIIQACL